MMYVMMRWFLIITFHLNLYVNQLHSFFCPRIHRCSFSVICFAVGHIYCVWLRWSCLVNHLSCESIPDTIIHVTSFVQLCRSCFRCSLYVPNLVLLGVLLNWWKEKKYLLIPNSLIEHRNKTFLRVQSEHNDKIILMPWDAKAFTQIYWTHRATLLAPCKLFEVEKNTDRTTTGKVCNLKSNVGNKKL